MVDVRGIVESAVQMAWHEIRHRARLVKSLAEVPPVEANEARLGQVFLNLLVNAAQAIPEGHADATRSAWPRAPTTRGNAVVEVSDTGMGIAPEDLPRIFDPFFTTKGESGTGLGLAISHGTVRGLGGDIEVASEPGKGTTFRVVLPPAKPWRGAAPSSAARRPGAAGARARPRHRRRAPRRRGHRARRSSDDSDVDVVTDAQRGAGAHRRRRALRRRPLRPHDARDDRHGPLRRDRAHRAEARGAHRLHDRRRVHPARARLPRERRQPVPREAARHGQAPQPRRRPAASRPSKQFSMALVDYR